MGSSFRDRAIDPPRRNLSIRTLPADGDGRKAAIDADAGEVAQRQTFARVIARGFEIAGWTEDRGAREIGYTNSAVVSQWLAGSRPVPMAKVWACEAFRPFLLRAQAEHTKGIALETVVRIVERGA